MWQQRTLSPTRTAGSLLAAFWRLLRSPARGVSFTLALDPSLSRIAAVLALIGLLRGITEGFWDYLMTDQVADLPGLLRRADWYWRYGGPFLLLNIPSAHFLWLTTAATLHGVARLLGSRSGFRPILQVTGVAMLSYLAIGLLNYLHLLRPLPSVTLHASAFYSPNLGIGQLLTFVWLTLVAYQVLRQVCQLTPDLAAVAAPTPILLALLLYAGSASAFFGVLQRMPDLFPPNRWLQVANLAYLAAILLLTAALALLARSWLHGKEGTSCTRNDGR